jgi:hypothetical protein
MLHHSDEHPGFGLAALTVLVQCVRTELKRRSWGHGPRGGQCQVSQETLRHLETQMPIGHLVLVRREAEMRTAILVPGNSSQDLPNSGHQLPLLRSVGAGLTWSRGTPQCIVRVEDEEAVPAEDCWVRHSSTPQGSGTALGEADRHNDPRRH